MVPVVIDANTALELQVTKNGVVTTVEVIGAIDLNSSNNSKHS